MSPADDEPPDGDPSTAELRAVQSSRARNERERATDADADAEAHTHDRRAEKAAYLAAKLAEKERSEGEAP